MNLTIQMYNCQELFKQMYKIDDIIARIKYFEEISSDTELSDILKVTPQNIYIWKKRNTIPYKELIHYCTRRNLSIDWILAGKTHKQSLKTALNTVNEPQASYADPKDEIIMRLEAENQRLRQLHNSIKSIMTDEHKAIADRRSRRKKSPKP